MTVAETAAGESVGVRCVRYLVRVGVRRWVRVGAAIAPFAGVGKVVIERVRVNMIVGKNRIDGENCIDRACVDDIRRGLGSVGIGGPVIRRVVTGATEQRDGGGEHADWGRVYSHRTR